MQLPRLETSYDKLNQQAAYIRRNLEIDGRAEDALSVQAMQETLKQASDKATAAELARFVARAPVARATHAARKRLVAIQHLLLSRQNGSRREPPFSQIFLLGSRSDQISEAPAAIRIHVERLRAYLPEGDALRAEAEHLSADADTLEQAREALEALDRQVVLTRNFFTDARGHFRRGLEQLYGKLLTEQGKAYAESFFPVLREPKKKPAEA